MQKEIYWKKGPNIAVLVMLAVPFVATIALGLKAIGVPLRAAAGAPMMICAFCAVISAAALAARLRVAPTVSAVLLMVSFLATGGADCTFFLAAGAGVAFWRREVYVRDLDWDALPEQVVEGLRVFLRDAPGAHARALAGLGLCVLGGVIIGAAMAGFVAEPPRMLFVAVLSGIGLLTSSLVVPDDA